MSRGLIESTLNMKMDIYEVIISQDENTGALVKKWGYKGTEPCLARGYISDTGRTGGSSEKIGERYENMERIIIETKYKSSKTQRITNIRNSKDEVIWFELINNNYDTPTIFDVMGVTPVLDPFGQILSFNINAQRSEVQKLEV
jgi:hypothetical protein